MENSEEAPLQLILQEEPKGLSVPQDLLEKSERAEAAARAQATEFLADLRPYGVMQTKSLISLFGKMARSGSWEPPDSKKALIWYVLEDRFLNSTSEQERAIAAKILSEMRKQDADNLKTLTDFVENLTASGLTKDIFDAEKEVFPPQDEKLSIRGMVTHIENMQVVSDAAEEHLSSES